MELTQLLESVGFVGFGKFRNFPTVICSGIFSATSYFAFPYGTIMSQMIDLLLYPYRFLRSCYFFFLSAFFLVAPIR